MTALTKERAGSVRAVTRDKRPLAADAKVYRGALAIAIISGTSKGFYQQGDDAVIGVAVGRFTETVDNTGGDDGDLFAEVHFFRERPLFLLNNDDGGSPLDETDREGLCYVLDDNTVTATVGSVGGGIVYDVTSEGVWVEIDAPVGGELAASLADVAPEDPSSSAASAGVASTASRQDHKHHIAVATTGAEGLLSAADKTILNHLAAPVLPLWTKDAADAGATDATAEHVIYRATGNETITALKLALDAALTAHDANYATIIVRKRDGAGGAASTVASKTTKITGGTGNITAFVPVDLGTITGGGLAAGTLLTVEITKAAGGVVVPSGELFATATVA